MSKGKLKINLDYGECLWCLPKPLEFADEMHLTHVALLITFTVFVFAGEVLMSGQISLTKKGWRHSLQKT